MSRGLIFMLLLICAACGNSTTTTTTGADDSSALFAALRPVAADSANDELVRRGQLVLVDDAVNSLPSGNPDYPLFVVQVDAYLRRNGEVGFHAFIGNWVEEPDGQLWAQCGPRRGVLRLEDGETYTFVENGQLNIEGGFDSTSEECGLAPPPHPAEQLFNREPITIAPAPDGDALLDFTTDSAGTYRFDVRPVIVPSPTSTTTAAATTIPPTQTRPVTFTDFEANVDGVSLSLLLDACGVLLQDLDIDVAETDKTITVEIVETFAPPTTSSLGEGEVMSDCQDALRIELDGPYAGQQVIDASTGREATSGE